MANKVYILTGGMPDERYVSVAFSTREAAQAALRYGDTNTAVQEVVLDPVLPAGPPGHSVWYVYEHGVLGACRTDLHVVEAIGKVTSAGADITVDVWARNKRQALKVGGELIERFKAGRARKGSGSRLRRNHPSPSLLGPAERSAGQEGI